MTDGVRVTAAIPAFQAERYLATAIESVLGQTRAPYECVVIDDGSSDSTGEIARSYKDVRCISQANGGDANARNRAIAEARGDLIAFLDADDVWLPRKLELQLDLFSRRPELGMVYSGLLVVDDELHRIEELRPAPGRTALHNTLLVEKPYMTGVGSSGIVRTEVAREVLFDERLGASADWAFACHVALRYPVESVDEPLVLYRQHAGSQVHKNLKMIERDMRLVWDELFRDPSLNGVLVGGRRRALANLDLSLSASNFKEGRRGAFLKHLTRAFLRRPDRVVAAFWRRYMVSM